MSYKSKPLKEMMPPRRKQIYEGQDKVLYEASDPSTCVLYFKDETARGEGPAISVKKSVIRFAYETIIGKGSINNRISELFLSRLTEIGVANHFIKRLNMKEQLIRYAEPLAFQVSMHNAACDHFATRLGLTQGTSFPHPIVEFTMKSRELRFPLVSQNHITALGWAEEYEIDYLLRTVQRVNDFLYGQFLALGIKLMSFTLEFGRIYLSDHPGDSQLIIIDEITPDTCYLLDLTTNKRLDKSCLDSSDCKCLTSVYQEVARRLGILSEGGPIDLREETSCGLELA